MAKVLSLIILVTATAQAAGGGHGSIADLKWPFVNFVLLFGFLLWKTRGPLAKVFEKNCEEVKSLYESAGEKSKEAQIQLDIYEKKIGDLDNEFKKVLNESEEEAAKFAQAQKEETKGLITKLEKDAESKIEHEKGAMVRDLERSLVEQVLDKVKATVGGDSNLKAKATQRLVSQIK